MKFIVTTYKANEVHSVIANLPFGFAKEKKVAFFLFG